MMNFPPHLAIRASDPNTAFNHLTNDPSLEPNLITALSDKRLISSQSTDIEIYGIAGRIWEAAYAMALYLQPPHTWEFEPSCSVPHEHAAAVIELGSGTGFLGFHLARLLSLRPRSSTGGSKSLILTDLEEVCPLLHRNRNAVEDSPGVDLVIQPLEWGNHEHGRRLAATLTQVDMMSEDIGLLSHIVCSDLVYFPGLFAPLLRTLLQLSSPPFSNDARPVQIIISYMIRSLTKETPFWSVFGTWFDFSPVLVKRESDPSFPWERFGSHQDGNFFVFVATRKAESFGLPVPDDDSTLMRSHDETFETLLLMNIATD